MAACGAVASRYALALPQKGWRAGPGTDFGLALPQKGWHIRCMGLLD